MKNLFVAPTEIPLTEHVSNDPKDLIENSLEKTVPYCQDVNPYLRANFGWVPQHIWIAPRHYYSYLAIYMTFLTSLCCFLNGIVLVATIKFKVSQWIIFMHISFLIHWHGTKTPFLINSIWV